MAYPDYPKVVLNQRNILVGVTYTIEPCLASTVNDCHDNTTRGHATVAVTDGRLVEIYTFFSQN